MPLRAGDLDRYVTLQRRALARNESNEDVGGWTDVEKLWAGIKRTGGGEAFGPDVRRATQQAVIRIRWRTGVEPRMRILADDGQAYEIEDVAEDPEHGRREALLLTCFLREPEPAHGDGVA